MNARYRIEGFDAEGRLIGQAICFNDKIALHFGSVLAAQGIRPTIEVTSILPSGEPGEQALLRWEEFLEILARKHTEKWLTP